MNRWNFIIILFVSAWSLVAHGYEDNASKPEFAIVNEYNERYTPGLYGNSKVNPYKALSSNFYNSYLRNAVPLEEEFNFERLIEIIDQKGLTTIESVIEELPDHMKRHNYVLMYRSRSLQEASPEAPRALVYTPTARFILSFNGGGRQLGANTIETIQFRPEEKKFEFRELVFDGVNRPRVSQANPAKCMECHQSPSRMEVDMRPNWEPYSVWVGAYGSEAGRLDNSPLKDQWGFRERLQPQDEEAFAEQAREFELFRNYIDKIAPKHPRYSRLGEPNVHAPTDLTNHLAFWNFMRTVRLTMEEGEVYEQYKEAIALAARCYNGPSDYEESEAIRWHMKAKVPVYFDDLGFASLRSLSSKITYLFEPLGIDTSDWSMDFGTKARFAFKERFGAPSNTQQIFQKAWEYVVPKEDQFKDLDCDALKERMVAKLDQAFAKGFQKEQREKRLKEKDIEPSAQNILQRCIKCHVTHRDSWIPYIPFDRPQELATHLNRPTSHHNSLFHEIRYRTSDMAVRREQMPPGGRLTAKEHEVLIKYLKELRDEN